MRLDRRIAAFALFACGAFPSLAPAQTAAAKPASVLELPDFDEFPLLYRVVEVDPRGTARLEMKPEFQRFKLANIEGYHVLALRPEKSDPRLYRVQITDVDSPTSVKLALSPEAAGALRKGDECYLVRPRGSTTAQLKALPGVIPFGDKAPAGGKASAPPDLNAARFAQQRSQSVNNLKEMGLALHNYHSTFNAFPPAVIFGPDGKPWHSWRVLILPYLEQTALYNQYDFNEPWNGPKNSKLLDKMPAVYRDPIYGNEKGHFTHYATLVGAWKVGKSEIHTVFPPAGIKQGAKKPDGTANINFSDPAASSMRNIMDGTSNTLGVVPVSLDRKIPWMKPEDITVTADFPIEGRLGGIATPYPTGAADAPHAALVLLMDGSIRTILDTANPVVLRALTTRDGGEVIDWDSVAGMPPAAPVARQEHVLKIHIDGAKVYASFD